MEKLNSWSDTLIEFLKSSNEDERVLALFLQNVLPEITGYFSASTLNWLEIGVGDGNKTLEIAKSIKKLNKFNAVNLTLCEPSVDWLVTLHSTGIYKQLLSCAKLEYITKSIEEFTEDLQQGHFDFVSLVQVMYNSSIKNALVKYIDEKPKDKASLIWVDVEDKSGDFYKMRQILIDQGMQVVHSFADELILDLESRGLSYKTFLTTKKICTISPKEVFANDKHWLFPFIVGHEQHDFDMLTSNEKQIIIRTVKSYIAQLKQPLLNIPDLSILIYT